MKLYRLYPLPPITLKIGSHRGDREMGVQQVQERSRFDNHFREVA